MCLGKKFVAFLVLNASRMQTPLKQQQQQKDTKKDAECERFLWSLDIEVTLKIPVFQYYKFRIQISHLFWLKIEQVESFNIVLLNYVSLHIYCFIPISYQVFGKIRVGVCSARINLFKQLRWLLYIQNPLSKQAKDSIET